MSPEITIRIAFDAGGNAAAASPRVALEGSALPAPTGAVETSRAGSHGGPRLPVPDAMPGEAFGAASASAPTPLDGPMSASSTAASALPTPGLDRSGSQSSPAASAVSSPLPIPADGSA